MSVAVSKGQSEKDAVYEVPDDQLAVGSTLGGPKATCVIKANGALKCVYDSDQGIFTAFGCLILRRYHEGNGMHLAPESGGKFIIYPERQEHQFRLPGNIDVVEDIFVLSTAEPGAATVDPPAVYVTVSMHNGGETDAHIATYAFCELRGDTEPDIVAEFDSAVRGLVAWNKNKPEQVRIIASSTKPASYETTIDAAKAVSGTWPRALSGDTEATQSPLGVLHHSHRIKPGETVHFNYILTVGNGRSEALQNLHACPPAERARERTWSLYHKMLKRSVVLSPSREVNRGVLWAKANMLRIMLKAPTGWCFVNDPTASNNSVSRDTSWFAFGADYFAPDFVRPSLLTYVDNQEKSGLVVEYYDVRNGKTADYKLNINDNTPLLILALWHHYNTGGDDGFLERVYPAAAKGARYLLSQRNDQGLVWCTADGTSDFGICGWRNVITDYRLSGATTEVNSECFAALQRVSQMARVLGRHDDSAEFADAAEELRQAINKHLLNPDNGMYYLNIDLDGRPHTDVTSDLVFPVMFRVATDETAAGIVSRLSDDDFWTSAGIRTTPRDAPNYDPDGRNNGPYGLLGGVWVGVSFWYAFAAAHYNPEFMDHALASTFENYSTDPRRNNTVPGQFSEWLHGETLVNQGMMLSPWFPPRYLWAAIEGMAGFDPSGGRLNVHPTLAPAWKWLGVQNLPYRGKSLTWLAVRTPDIQLYSNFTMEDGTASRSYECDISEQVHALGQETSALGFQQGASLLVFVGSAADRTLTTSVTVALELTGSYRLRAYHSLIGKWIDHGLVPARKLREGQVLEIERKGFSLLEFEQEV